MEKIPERMTEKIPERITERMTERCGMSEERGDSAMEDVTGKIGWLNAAELVRLLHLVADEILLRMMEEAGKCEGGRGGAELGRG